MGGLSMASGGEEQAGPFATESFNLWYPPFSWLKPPSWMPLSAASRLAFPLEHGVGARDPHGFAGVQLVRTWSWEK